MKRREFITLLGGAVSLAQKRDSTQPQHCIVDLIPKWHPRLMPRRPKTNRLKSRDPGSFKGLLIRMNIAGWRELRILAAERDTTLNALAIEALNDLLKKRGKEPVVENPLKDDN
jgi:hypothetical protein